MLPKPIVQSFNLEHSISHAMHKFHPIDSIKHEFHKGEQIIQDLQNYVEGKPPVEDSVQPMDDTEIPLDTPNWQYEDAPQAKKEIPVSLDPDAHSTYAQIVQRYGFNYSSH